MEPQAGAAWHEQSVQAVRHIVYPDYLSPEFHWQMSPSERAAMFMLLEQRRPHLALEIGTAGGGSLQLIHHFAERVISIDSDPDVARRLQPSFPNVEFITGRSEAVLPGLLERLTAEGQSLDFVLIDGDHSEKRVRRDIEMLMAHRPKRHMIVALHDSFTPGTRKGMLAADWAANPQVHYLDLDFAHGSVLSTPERPRKMVGGIAVAVLLPEPRRGELVINQREKELFEIVYAVSSNARTLRGALIRLRGKLLKRARRARALLFGDKRTA